MGAALIVLSKTMISSGFAERSFLVGEVDQKDVPAGAVLRHLEEIHDAVESALPGERPRDVGQPDRHDPGDHDMPLLHAIAAAHRDVATLPDTDGAGDLASADSVAELLGEDHDRNATTVRKEGSAAARPRKRGVYWGRMSARMKIDFVSDVSCPWCAIALSALEAALARIGSRIDPDLRFQPFELNPDMGEGGQDIVEHLSEKYGTPPAQIDRAQELIRARGAEVGFTFDLAKRTRIYNTFDAHRLLHWAGLEGKQRALKHALFAAYFTEGRDPSDHEVLIELAARVGLDADRARGILASSDYADEVRAHERLYQDRGIHAVPAVIVNDRYLIQGGQPAQVFEELLSRFASEAGPAS